MSIQIPSNLQPISDKDGKVTTSWFTYLQGIGKIVLGNGTVTSVSVVSANGFSGTVASPTSTPALTLKTTITGLLKGNGTAISAATAGTDYISPTAVNPALGPIDLSISTSQTKIVFYAQASCILDGIYHRCFSIGTAGTFKLQKNGVDITGLTGLIPTTSGSVATASSPVSLVATDVITIVSDGTLVSIGDLFISPKYTLT